MMQIIYLVIQVLSLVGLISGILMFWLVMEPDKEKNTHSHPYVSIIIPARDEAQRLPWLLESIRSQNWHHYEIMLSMMSRPIKPLKWLLILAHMFTAVSQLARCHQEKRMH